MITKLTYFGTEFETSKLRSIVSYCTFSFYITNVVANTMGCSASWWTRRATTQTTNSWRRPRQRCTVWRWGLTAWRRASLRKTSRKHSRSWNYFLSPMWVVFYNVSLRHSRSWNYFLSPMWVVFYNVSLRHSRSWNYFLSPMWVVFYNVSLRHSRSWNYFWSPMWVVL